MIFLFWLVFLLVILAYSVKMEGFRPGAMAPRAQAPPAPPPVMWDYVKSKQGGGWGELT